VIFSGNSSGEVIFTLAVDDESVYVYRSFGDGTSEIRKVSKAGDTADVIASGLARTGTMTVSGPYLYVTESGTEAKSWHDGIVWRMPKAGGPREVLADGQGWPMRSVLGSGVLYWLDGRAPDAGIKRRDDATGAITAPVATGGSDLVLGAGLLCWTEPNSDPYHGDVRCMNAP
jgi:hypothetical protein